MTLPWLRRQTAFAVVLFVTACSDSGPVAQVADSDASSNSTFGQLQRSIFDRKCISCHSTNAVSAVARQSGLSLQAGVSYQNLFAVRPVNLTARQDGLLRVTPGIPGRSLLFHKLVWSPEHHAGRNYGNPMPLGGEPLSVGQLEFVRRWIAEGAPRTGFVADSTLLADTRKQYVEAFQPLPLPTSGYQLHMDSFPVTANFERELFLYRRVGNPEDIYINRIETRVRFNTHHMLLMTFREETPARIYPTHDVIRDIRAPDGSMLYENMLVMGWHQFFAGANTPYEDKRLPAGVALKLPANASLDINAHVVNTTPQASSGEAFVNLHTVPASQVERLALPFYLMHDTFALPPGQRTTVTRTFLFDRPMSILMLTSHNHELGQRFEIRIAGGPRNGELVYVSTDWKHPVILWFDQPLVLQAGQGLTSVVTYNNTRGYTVVHGLLTTDEMDIMRGYAY
jgi:hypothetical protein